MCDSYCGHSLPSHPHHPFYPSLSPSPHLNLPTPHPHHPAHILTTPAPYTPSPSFSTPRYSSRSPPLSLTPHPLYPLTIPSPILTNPHHSSPLLTTPHHLSAPHQVLVVVAIVFSILLYRIAISAVLYVPLVNTAGRAAGAGASIFASITGACVQLVGILIMNFVSASPVDDTLETHCHVGTTGEQILMSIYVHCRINQSIATDGRMFQRRRPSSTEYLCMLIKIYSSVVDSAW